MRTISTGLSVLAFIAIAPAAQAWAQPQDSNFTQQNYAAGVGSITDIAWAGDGTNQYLFFTQQGGAIRVIRNGTLQSGAVANVSPIVSGGELGLLGLAIDPAFSTNRRIYIYVSETSTLHRIYRYTTTDSGGVVGITGGRMQMGVDIPSRNVNHDGGSLAFGQDGYLYFGVGNMGNGNNVGGNFLPPDNLTNPNPNELDTLGSKVGRMMTSGAAVTTNPYYTAGTDTARDYIYSRGYRNPFGIAFRPGDAEPWILEVGDGWEHIFRATSGSNRGWPTENNTSTTNGKLIPRFAYQRIVPASGTSWRDNAGCITKGCFYTGTVFPAAYQGNLFFTEHNAGKLIRLIPNGTGTIPAGNASLFVNGIGGIVDVETGFDGALYYAGRSAQTIYRLYYSAGGTQGIILSTGSMSVNEGASGTIGVRLAIAPSSNVSVSVTRSSGSTDIATSPATVTLTFTPSNWNTNQNVSVAAAEDADTTNDSATITASSTGLTSQNVNVTQIDNDTAANAPTATITQPSGGSTISGNTAEFYGDGADAQGVGTLVRAEFYIDNVLHYTDTTAGGHYHIGGSHQRFNTTSLSNGSHTLRMVVFDNTGLSGSHQITVNVDNSGGAPGLLGQYFNNIDLTGLAMTRVDPGVDFNWGTGGPDPAIGADTFSVRWSGRITPAFNETYTFYTYSDDGSRLWVNGQLLVDHWTDQGPTEWSGQIGLTAGQAYDVVFEYFENGGGAVAQFSWSSPSQPKGLIPSSALTNASQPGFGGGPPAGGGSDSDDSRCGATGMEIVGLAALLMLRRRRRP